MACNTSTIHTYLYIKHNFILITLLFRIRGRITSVDISRYHHGFEFKKCSHVNALGLVAFSRKATLDVFTRIDSFPGLSFVSTA